MRTLSERLEVALLSVESVHHARQWPIVARADPLLPVVAGTAV